MQNLCHKFKSSIVALVVCNISRTLNVIFLTRSLEFKCSDCGPVSTILKPVTEASKESNREAKELAKQINFQVYRNTKL